MNLAALQHLANAASALADDCRLVVIGSASLLASFPDLGHDDGPLAQTFDADLCPEPFDETTALMLDQALGESKAFHLRHGYHADIVRPRIFETLPRGWHERLVPMPGVEKAMALDPVDLAAVKVLVGRAKYVSLVRLLIEEGRVTWQALSDRVFKIELDERLQRRVARTLDELKG
jgi:hypothetical protein